MWNYDHRARHRHLQPDGARLLRGPGGYAAGRFLPGYRRRPKRRVVAAPKFYFGDVGVVNFLARRGALQPGGELFGKAFENWVFHERRRSAGCARITARGCAS
ncbi:MAG: DUF4143 domain-containing protein [Spirochaetaceae bacterium]|nr:DUF4143 domain-containing protein [Spirochaetaceae bacterium]